MSSGAGAAVAAAVALAVVHEVLAAAGARRCSARLAPVVLAAALVAVAAIAWQLAQLAG